MSPPPGPPRVARILSALATAALFGDAIAHHPAPPGLSTFGRPAALAALWIVAGLLSAFALLAADDRARLARRLTLVLLCGSLFGQRGIGADPFVHLGFTGVVLLVAGPWLRRGAPLLLSGAMLLSALPAAAASRFPQGTLTWLAALAPWAALAILLPALFAGRRLHRALFVLTGSAGALALLSLLDYIGLAAGLELPLGSLAATRCRPLGMHPNLAVPQLVFALLAGCALLWSGGSHRPWLALALLCLTAALAAVQSRTGFLTAAGGFAALILGRFPWRGARFVHPAALVLVVGFLLLPATSVTAPAIPRAKADASMVSKAVSFRAAMWELGREAAIQAPWHGFGPGTTWRQAAFARPSRYDGLPKDDHPHNVVLAVGASLGIPGLFGLALLLAASLRRGFGGPLPADGILAAMLAVWTADALDMGGAERTLFPALAFLGLGLSAAAHPPASPRPAPAPRGLLARSALALVALLLVVLGSSQAVGGRILDSAQEVLGDPGARKVLGPADRELLERRLALAGRLRPNDPAVPEAAAALALAGARPDEQLRHLEEARARFPDSPTLAHAVALLAARADPDEARVGALLDLAVEGDPYGPDAWRRRVDRAVLSARRGAPQRARDDLLEALLLNPAAARRVVWRPDRKALFLSLDGIEGLEVPLDELLEEVRRRRDELGEVDPPQRRRLLTREIEILLVLGEWEWAEALARDRIEREPENEVLWRLCLARSAVARGDAALAAERFTSVRGLRSDMPIVVEDLENRVAAEPLDAAACSELVALGLANLLDVTFESQSLVRFLAARKRLAERMLEPLAAERWARALDYAQR